MQGIYAIKNTVNGKIYIGSTNNYTRRKWEHLARLRSDNHGNEYLQRSWNKYGEDAFEFIFLYEVEDELLAHEQKCVDVFAPEYNMAEIVRRVWQGRKHSEKTKKLLSDKAKARYKERGPCTSKLTKQDVVDIRQAYLDGATQAGLAEKYAVGWTAIGSVVRGESWPGIGPDASQMAGMRKGSRHGLSKLKEEDVPVIREMIASGMPDTKIASMYNISTFPIYQIRTGKGWNHV